MRTRTIAAIVAASLLATAAGAEPSHRFEAKGQLTSAAKDATATPAQVLTRIRTDGARPTLEALHRQEGSWRGLLAGIATGGAEWLQIAKALHAVADGGASEQIEMAVGEALGRQPSNVLALSVGEFGLASICSGPDVDDNRFNAYDLSMAALADRQRALRGVGEASLASARDGCIASLEDSKRGIARFFGVTP